MKIKNLRESAIKNNFSVSDMLGDFDISEFNGRELTEVSTIDKSRTPISPVKMMITATDISLTDQVIQKLMESKKYIIGDMVTISKAPSIKNSQKKDSIIREAKETKLDSYTFDRNKDGSFNEYYEKGNQALRNKGVFFLASEIDGNIHLFSLNVLTPGQTGKSVSLSYLPNGDMRKAVMLERYCYHGTNGNEHQNPDGEIVDRTDTHIHRTSEAYLDEVISSDTPIEKKISNLNSPPAIIQDESVLPDEANISKMVEAAMVGMNISPDFILTQIEPDQSRSIIPSIKDGIEACEMSSSYMDSEPVKNSSTDDFERVFTN